MRSGTRPRRRRRPESDNASGLVQPRATRVTCSLSAVRLKASTTHFAGIHRFVERLARAGVAFRRKSAWRLPSQHAGASATFVDELYAGELEFVDRCAIRCSTVRMRSYRQANRENSGVATLNAVSEGDLLRWRRVVGMS